MVRRAFIACLLAVATLAAAQGPDARTLRVLFIGNSLTYTGDIPGRFAKLAAAMGRKASVDTVAFPDFSLEDHWRDGRALAAIRKGWDVVVLQQGTSSQADSRAQRDFGAAIGAYRDAASAVDGILLPVGEAWLRALSVDKRLRLYSDTILPASLGGDLAVLTIYLTLFPAGPQEFDEAFVARAARALEIPTERRDLLFDAATRAIDEPMTLK